MKTISDYSIYCTPEQTKKALGLGAPIYVYDKRNSDAIRELDVTLKDKVELPNGLYAEIPIAEQMIGWLEEQEKIDFFCIANFGFDLQTTNDGIIAERNFPSRKEATLAAIDAALEYLVKNDLTK